MSNSGDRFYAFLYHDESADADDGASLLRFEVLKVDWFHRVWAELGNPALAATLPRVQGSGFATAYAGLGAGTRSSLYDLHRRYSERTLKPGDLAPVGILEALVSHDVLPREQIREANWYEVCLTGGTPLGELRNPEQVREAILSMLGETEGDDTPPTLHYIEALGAPGGGAENWVIPILPALHFPQVAPGADFDPEPGPEGGSRNDFPSGGMDADGGSPLNPPHGPRPAPTGEAGVPPYASIFDDSEFAHCPHSPCTCRWRALDEFIPRWRRCRWASVSSGSLAAAADAAAPASLPISISISAAAASGDDLSKSGGVHAMQQAVAAPAVAFPAPPLAGPGGYQPFVGINWVGAGNNVAVWDHHGRLAAYVDYGLPVPANKNTYSTGATAPCVCSDPLMVLTHWDYDHCAMVRRVPQALKLRWVAPRQSYGPATKRILYQPLRANVGHGARLLLWGKRGGHVVAPFGVLVRADGTHTPNEDGIAAYVRVDGGGANSTPVSSQLGPRETTRIEVGELPGEWIDAAVLPPFSGTEVVVPAAVAHAFAAPDDEPAPDDERHLGLGVWGKWIPPIGVPCASGAMYVPSAGQGGWAVSAEDFVASGGVIIDCPGAETGHEGTRVLSPTPGLGWEPDAGRQLVPFPADGLEKPDGTRWFPVWGPGPCLMEPGPSDGEVLAVSDGDAPMGDDEYYVLLPGDAGFQHIPPQRASVPPAVVGVVASHHGSATWISPLPAKATADLARIPDAGAAPGCEQIAYSYGTRPNGKHCYAHGTRDGHPHGRAIHGYEGKNWGVTKPVFGSTFSRLNTATEDYTSNQAYNPLTIPRQPGAAALYALGHRNGNVALGWDAAAGGPLGCDHLPAGVTRAASPASGLLPPLRRTCPTCPSVRDYYF
ncbi:MAG TPA: hypothetical protein VGX50_08735 [Longimicrobium sp.]|jgi:hypothetical protein|nr:hypothetical protein [Longimicrobium sp.]